MGFSLVMLFPFHELIDSLAKAGAALFSPEVTFPLAPVIARKL